MNKEEIKIITLGDIFRNLETEEQAFEFLKYIKNLQQENKELKKQLEKKNKPQIFIDTQDIEERYAEGLYQDYLEEENKKYKNQQKEFIKWLEDYLNLFDYRDIDEQAGYDMLEEILQKYKEIIGGKDEDNKQ